MIIKELKFGKKYITISITVIILIIPIFFGIYSDFLFVSHLNLSVVLFLLIGFVFLLGIGIMINNVVYSERSKELIKQHDVIKALSNGNGLVVLLVFFPLTMIMEEFIFRYYLIGLLLYELNIGLTLTIILESFIFSIYHLHIWFRFKDLKILISYLLTSFLLGIYNGYMLFTLGIFACIVAHSILVFLLYYNLYKKLS